MKYYLEETSKVFEELNTGENGLTSAEAEKRLAEKGKNKLKEPEKESLFKKFLNSLADPMIIMLLVAALIQAGVAVFEAIKAGNGFKLTGLGQACRFFCNGVCCRVKRLQFKSAQRSVPNKRFAYGHF